MVSFAEKVISFYSELTFYGKLPEGIHIMNPVRENNLILPLISEFYRKYYSDFRPRHIILGINPGRFGAGVTGLPFTDTIRLKEKCGLSLPGINTFETSSVFVYEMIERYGGNEKFYGDYFISSVSPLGFTYLQPGGRKVNFNYYDSRELTESIRDFAVNSIRRQLEFGIARDVCFCLGTGKNYSFLSKLNDGYGFFKRIEPLEHPRFIMQYRSKQKEYYIRHYLEKLNLISS